MDRLVVEETGDEAPPGAGNPDLEMVLKAWNVATDRLQATHETLRHEVQRLTDELETKNRELARKNRLADLGQMASHVAHEVRNGLVPLTLYLSLLRRRLSQDPDCLTVMDKIEAGFTALEATVNDLLNFSSHHDPEWQRFCLATLVHDVVESLAPQLAAQGIRTSTDVPDVLEVRADPNMIRRAFLNLLLNAVDVMPHGGELDLTVWAGPEGVELEVADSGPGVAGEVQTRMFEPFFSTKAGGTGLGLAIVERIAAAHGGAVRVDNCPQGGAAITLRIPYRTMEAAA